MRGEFYYIEDYEIGQEGETLSRTVGETDIATFAYITADYASVHLDRHISAEGPYGERIAHGLLGSSLVPGMISQTAPQIVGRGVPEAFFSGFETNYRGPIKLGDSIRIKWRVSEKAYDPALDGFALLKTAFQVVNQDGVSAYDGILTTRVREKSAGGKRLKFKAGIPWQINEFVLNREKIYYLEDFVVGEGEEIKGRTFTEADVVNFAGLTGDYNPLYVDVEYAKGTVFGERVVPGMLAFTAVFGLWARDTEFFKARMSERAETYAGHLADGASFLAPVKIGDTLHCLYKIDSTRASKSKPEMGIVKLSFQVINQRGEVVQEGFTLLTRATKASEK
jgi:acyl dehydratase